ncbi:MAG: hypothetical protein Q4B17_10525 [Lautropia sp.]|nr:hypothetical protein [Lautropia sp.]
MAGMDEHYLKELEQFLEAEEEMARQGVDLLADPEYRTLRELYIDGEIDQAEFLGRIEALAASRPDEEGVSFTVLEEAEEALLSVGGGSRGDDDEFFVLDANGDEVTDDDEDEDDTPSAGRPTTH